jgi:hypothetical protein
LPIEEKNSLIKIFKERPGWKQLLSGAWMPGNEMKKNMYIAAATLTPPLAHIL